MEKTTKHLDEKIKKKVVETLIINGSYSLRGRKFEGYVIKKFDNRVTIKFERMIFIRKYERYLKTYSKMHARLPAELREQINVGDYIQIMECRPLSKIIHFIVTKKIRDADSKAAEIMREKREIKQKKAKKEVNVEEKEK